MTKEGKICKGCGDFEPYSNFYKRSANKDGHVAQCKVCNRIDRETRWVPRSEQSKQSRGEQYFVEKYGVSGGTVRSWYYRTHYGLWGELSESEKLEMVKEYKAFRNRKRRGTRTLK